jgi:tetratricopeptide (TPR) repeat protein
MTLIATWMCLSVAVAASSGKANAADAIANNIAKSVQRLGYPTSTADDLARLAADWKLEDLKEKCDKARSASPAGNKADAARVEGEVAQALYTTIQRNIEKSGKEHYFYLSAVVKDKKAQCLGYCQLFYVLGKSLGLHVGVINVSELAAGPLPAEEGHVVNVVGLSDGRMVIVDLAHGETSKPFVFKDAFAASGNYWEVKEESNPLQLPRRIQALDEKGIAACIYTNLAREYLGAGRLEQAVSYSSKAIELNPVYADAYINRGTSLAKTAQYKSAIADFSKALELDPKSAAGFCDRGLAYSRMGDHAKAVADFSKAIEIDPKFAAAYANRGNEYGGGGRIEQAISDCTKAIELDPKLAEAYNNRANAYMRSQKIEKATSDYTTAVTLNPKYAAAYYNRGVLYGRTQKFPEAAADLTKVITLDPKHAEAHYLLGATYAAMGKTDDAKKYLQIAVKLDPKLADKVKELSDSYHLDL